MNVQTQEEKFVDVLRNILQIISDCDIRLRHHGIDTIPGNSLDVAFDYIKVSSGRFMMEKFIEKSYSYWDRIFENNEDFFKREVATILGMPDSVISSYVSLFERSITAVKENGEKIVPDSIIQNVWRLIMKGVRVSIRHIQLQRRISPEYFGNISLEKEVKKWGLPSV